MKKETVSLVLGYLLFVILILSFSYMLIENTRLTVVNHKLESELVDSQNQAWGYKWQLHQINRDSGWSETE